MDKVTGSLGRDFISQRIFSLKCTVCSRYVPVEESGVFCDVCRMSFQRALRSRNQIPDRVGFVKLYSMARYQGSVKKYLKFLKRSPYGRLDFEHYQFLKIMISHYSAIFSNRSYDLLVSVPSNPVRVFWESDLSYLLGKLLAQSLQLPYAPEILSKNLWSWNSYKAQKKLGARERRLASRADAFQVPRLYSRLLQGRKVLLVDDLCVSGSSLNFCSLHLKKAGALSQDAFSFAISEKFH